MKTKRLSHHRLYELRLRSGKSQVEVAHELRSHGFRVDPTAISRWERGKHEPGAGVIPSLAEVYGVATDDLYTSDDDEEELAPRLSLATDLERLARVAAVLERRPDLIEDILAAEDSLVS